MKILYQMCIWITRIAYINLLWIGFSLIGLVVFGALPATTAMFGVIRKWILGDEDLPVFKTFWDLYKMEFLSSNVLGYILVVIGGILYIDFRFVNTLEGNISFLLTFAILPFIFFYFVMLLYIFPVFSHFNMKMTQYFKWAFILGVKHLLLTVSMFVIVFLLLYLTLLKVPAMFIFFGASGNAFVLMWGAHQTFEKYEM